jgi:hypothetical protein
VTGHETGNETGNETGHETDAERRERRERVFGDVLPEGTRDDQATGEGEPSGAGAGSGEEWLRRQVPPHHG